jgi:uncharacterized membrane protein YphA (DoxX/SURF4 family)
MTTNLDNRVNTLSPAVLSLFRVVFGFLFTMFGTSHMFDWPIVPPEMGGNGGLSAILFCFAFLLLVFTGPGAFALDSVFGGGRRAAAGTTAR